MEATYFFDLLGTMVFAISGCSAAAQKNIDVFGITFCGFVTAIGGGSLRDVFLNTQPVWINDSNYLLAICIGVLITIFFKVGLSKLHKTLFLFDALGIGFFTVVGLQKSLSFEVPEATAIVMGMFSAVMGGVIRDTLMHETPLIFRREIYATACLFGAVLYIILLKLGVGTVPNILISAGAVFLIRILSVRFKLSLPIIGG
jgi:uncharacterized membrane protein YeiH